MLLIIYPIEAICTWKSLALIMQMRDDSLALLMTLNFLLSYWVYNWVYVEAACINYANDG